jgi:hypothetical protein
MRNLKRAILLGPFMALLLVGCDLFAGGPVTPPPPPAEALQSTPVSSPEPAASAIPSVDGRANLGDILFERDGQLWALSADGSNERPLTALPGGSVLRDLAISLDGRYLAFSLNAVSMMVLDLSSGALMPIDQIAAGSVGPFVWSPTGDSLYYHKLVLDANSVPSTSEIWRATVTPGSAPQLIQQASLADGSAVAPAFALADGTLIFHQFSPAEASMGRWLSYNLAVGESTPLFADYGLWGISPDSSQVLLFSQADVTPGQQRIPAPLYQAALAVGAGAAQVSPQGEESAYWSARFAPDGSRIMALRYVKVNDVIHGEAVLLRPTADASGYEVIQLSPDPGAEDVAFSWHGEDGIVVQRLRAGVAEALAAELWLLPLDGSPGRMLTLGEMPLVVGGR